MKIHNFIEINAIHHEINASLDSHAAIAVLSYSVSV